MKKIVALLLAMLLICSLLPLTAMAEGAEIQVKFFAQASSSITLKPTVGTVTYLTTNDAHEYVKWTDKENAPTDKFVKLEVSEDGTTLNVTLQNIEVENTQTAYTKPALHFSAGDYAVNITLVGASKLNSGNSPCIKSEAAKGITITGDGSLVMYNNKSAAACLGAYVGDLVIKNTTVDMTMAQGNSSLHHAIYSAAGNVTIEGSKVTATTDGGAIVYFGTTDPYDGRSTPDTNADRKLVIKDSEIIAKCINRGKLFVTASSPVISGSTMQLTGKSGPLFTTAPTFEGVHTALGGLAKNANDLTKLKLYQESKLSSYTYIHLVPTVLEGFDATEPSETTPANPQPEATEPPEDGTLTPQKPQTQATQPTETQPTETQPVETQPAETEPTNTDKGEKGGSMTLLIILVALIVVAVGAFGAILFLQQKKLKES